MVEIVTAIAWAVEAHPHAGSALAALPGAALVQWIAAHPLAFIQVVFGLGFVIFVHELGHFLVAKACGVKCEKFYLGFDVGGLKLCKFTWGETEYGIGALPLGGYVKMLGQDDNPSAAAAENQRARASGDLPAEPTSDPHAPWDPRSYPAQTVPERMAIISAGVVMNVIFAVLMAALAYGLGVEEVPAGTSAVRPGGAAWRAGLRTGDDIVAIGGRPVTTFEELQKGISLGDLAGGIAVTVRRPDDVGGGERTVTLEPDTDIGVPTVGISGPVSLRVATAPERRPVGSAAVADPPLEPGDVIEAVDGEAVASFAHLAELLAARADRPVRLAVRRAETKAEARRLEVTLPPQPRLGLGIVTTMEGVKAVQAGSPAEAAGFQVGDRLVRVDGAAVGDPLLLDDRLRDRVGQPVAVVVERAGTETTLEVVPRAVTWIDDSPLRGTPLAVSSLGIALPLGAVITDVTPGSPAAAAGIAAGERITRLRFVVPGETPADDDWLDISDTDANWAVAMTILQMQPEGTKVALAIDGPTGAREVDVSPEPLAGGWRVLRGVPLDQVTRATRAGSVGAALRRGFSRALEDLSMVYRFLQKLWGGQISARLLGGPGSIAQQAGKYAEAGFAPLLLFLTMLSANLAVVNFLPIPVLDGGHMVFLAWELVTGKPPSERVVIALSYVGLLLILSLMVWVFGLDLGLVSRLAPAK